MKIFQWWFIIFLLIPFIWSVIINLQFTASIHKTELFPEGKVEGKDTTLPSFYDRFADLWLGGPFSPTGLRICAENNNKVYINNIEINLPYEKDPETGAMELVANFSDNTSQKFLYIPIKKYECGVLLFKRDVLFASTTVIFRHPSEIPIMLSKDETGKLGGIGVVGVDPGESRYTIYQLWSDRYINLLKITGAWWIFVFAIIQSIQIAKKGSNYFSKKKDEDTEIQENTEKH